MPTFRSVVPGDDIRKDSSSTEREGEEERRFLSRPLLLPQLEQDETRSLTTTMEKIIREGGKVVDGEPGAPINGNDTEVQAEYNRDARKLFRESATEEEISIEGGDQRSSEEEESKERYGSPMLSPRSNRPSENITYRSIGLLSRNLSVKGANNFDLTRTNKESYSNPQHVLGRSESQESGGSKKNTGSGVSSAGMVAIKEEE